ncbi:MAG: ATP-binding protein [Bacteroidota bacterium]
MNQIKSIRAAIFLIWIGVSISAVCFSQSPSTESTEDASASGQAGNGGDSWQDIMANGGGKVKIAYTHNVPFIYYKPNGDLEGIEYELVVQLIKFLEEKYEVELDVEWHEEPTFQAFYNHIKYQKSGALGVSSVSITKTRKSEVKFSPPYIPDIEVIISSGNIPVASSMAEFSDMVSQKQAVTLEESTFEENFKYIQKNYFPHLKYAYSPNLAGILDTVASNDDLYAYVQITNYGTALEEELNVKRQRFFMVENPGLAMVMPLKSDWDTPVNAFFTSDKFQPLVDSLTLKYLGATTSALLHEVTNDTTKVDYKVHLGNEIQLLTAEGEIQDLMLKQKELELGRTKMFTNLLIAGIVLALIVVGALVYFYLNKRVINKQLAKKNEEIASKAKSLRRSYRDLELLSEAGKDITSNLSVEKIIGIVYHNIDALIGADVFGLGLYNKKTKTLSFNGAMESGKPVPAFEIDLIEGSYLAANCFKNRKEIFIDDFHKEHQIYLQDFKHVGFGRQAASVIYFPLMMNSEVMGVITVQSNEKHAFTDYHLNILRNLSIYTGIALQNARAYEEIQIKTKHLKSANENITEQNKQIEEQNDALVQLDNEKNHLIGIVAHDLRSPLASVLGIINLMKLQEDSLSKEMSDEYIAMIEQALHRMKDMISRILDLRLIESQDININLESVNLSHLLNNVVNNYTQSALKKQIEISVEVYDVYAVVDKGYSTQVFENLLSNAIKFSPKGKCIKVRLEELRSCIQIQVIDEGPGINDEDKKKLFGKFQKLTARPTGGEQSMGLGLSIVKKFVDIMQGKIWCESEPGNGAMFVVQFKKGKPTEEMKVSVGNQHDRRVS